MKWRVFLMLLLALGGWHRAQAVPTLQLDIVGGVYDASTETIVSTGPAFTLAAILTPKQNASAADINALLADTYFISAALTPITDSPANLGSFEFDEATINATADMEFGVPPLDDAFLSHDAQDLSKHSIFETAFTAFDFQFDAGDTTSRYNTADTPGGPMEGAGAFFATFDVDKSSLAPGYGLHFDLYNTEIARIRGPRLLSGPFLPDIDVGIFAPFSHDAESGRQVPVPGTLLLLGAGCLAVRTTRRRR